MPGTLTALRSLQFINLGDYCVIDGVTDDSVQFTKAYNAAAASNRTLWHPGGTLIKGNDTLSNTVRICGPGASLATIKLKNGANTDLFSANTANISLTGAFGTGPTTGVKGNGWGFSGITLDGNYTNQSAGPSWVLRYYGYGELFEDLIIQNGYSGGVLRDWYAATPNALTGTWENVQPIFNNGDGIVIGGPTDLKFTNVHPNNNYGNNWHICQNAGGLNAVNCHSWAPNNSAGRVTSLLIEAGDCVFTGLECEGSDTAQIVVLSDRNIINGWMFAGTRSGAGVKIGQQSGETPFLNQQQQSAGVTTLRYVNSNNIDVVVTDITSANGSIWYDADGGNIVNAVTSQSSGVYSSGSSGSGIYDILGTGLTPDGSLGKGPSQQYYSSAFRGYVIGRSSDGKIWFVTDTFDGAVTLENGALLAGYSDNFTTQQWSINGSNGNFATNGNISTGIVTKTTTYTIGAGDSTILANATTAAFTVTLPTAVGIAGRRYAVKKTDSSANAVTVGTTSSQTIDGATTKVLSTQYASIEVVSDGANWNIL